MPKLSVIVPVYNARRYLGECINSLLGQTFADMEIILVNDGSADDSAAICDAYQSRRPDIIEVIHQENKGVSAARNTGIDAASGEWISFVDSDDWVDPDMAQVMLTYADSSGADIHFFGFHREYVGHSVPRRLPELTLSTDAKKNYLYQNEVNLVSHTAVWGKFYRRAFLTGNGLYFDTELPRSEDELFLLYALYHADGVRLHPECPYHYRVVASSAINKWNPEAVSHMRLFQDRYAAFVDSHFTGAENRLMKQSKAIHHFLLLARVYSSPGAKLGSREIIRRLRRHLREEPLKTAVSSIPLSHVGKRRQWQVRLLRLGLVSLWLRMFRAADRVWLGKTAGQGHEMYP